MASKAIRTQGTKIEYLSTPPATYSVLGEIISFDGPGGKSTIIDTTNLASIAKEKLPGLPDEGSFSISCNFAGGDAGQLYLAGQRTAQALVTLRITFTDTTTCTFTAYCLEYKVSGKADSKVELAITLEITGACTWVSPAGLLMSGPHTGKRVDELTDEQRAEFGLELSAAPKPAGQPQAQAA